MPDDPNAYGVAMWMDNHKSFILYDRYDLWLVDASGLNASQLLTKGRASKTEYRFVKLDDEKKVIGFKDRILLKSYNEINKKEGIAILDMGNRSLFTIVEQPMHFTTMVGAKNTNQFIVMQEDEKNAAHGLHDKIKQLEKELSNFKVEQIAAEIPAMISKAIIKILILKVKL